MATLSVHALLAPSRSRGSPCNRASMTSRDGPGRGVKMGCRGERVVVRVGCSGVE